MKNPASARHDGVSVVARLNQAAHDLPGLLESTSLAGLARPHIHAGARQHGPCGSGYKVSAMPENRSAAETSSAVSPASFAMAMACTAPASARARPPAS